LWIISQFLIKYIINAKKNIKKSDSKVKNKRITLNDQDKIKWFDRAVKFQLDGLIFLTMKSRKSNGAKWAIEDWSNPSKIKVLNSNMEWEDELPKAKRDEAFLIRTRFDFESALMMYEQYKMFTMEPA